MHPESPGYVFFTTLAYVALRLLGCDPDMPLLVKARTWLQAQPGGVKAIPSWGKFWLAMLGLYGYQGLNAVPPELFLLPRWLPFHPRRFYCHTRLIYLGIAYLFGRRFVAPCRLPCARRLSASSTRSPMRPLTSGRSASAYRPATCTCPKPVAAGPLRPFGPL